MMRRIRSKTFSILFLLVAAAPCLAQATATEGTAKSYVTSYFIVGLGVALGLVAVCRGSKRRAEVRKPDA